ncbi:hypothetical protein BJ165DRAFT_1531787 [Panaeolus papilionaceus]|nr:hypothetical protein BJ165DRAFT_1531787 [Panaeolus papilionaceus]
MTGAANSALAGCLADDNNPYLEGLALRLSRDPNHHHHNLIYPTSSHPMPVFSTSSLSDAATPPTPMPTPPSVIVPHKRPADNASQFGDDDSIVSAQQLDIQ